MPEIAIASEDLDALVAEKVMGWIEDTSYDGWAWYTGPRGNHKRTRQQSSAWSPSEDISDAWDVVEKLAADGAKVSVHNRAVGPWACAIILHTGSGKERSIMEYAETAPLAICCAALATLASPTETKP